jgi:hypothetical protein
MIDQFMTGVGLASQTAKAHQWQARILWIDGTANIDRYNTPGKIAGLTKLIADSGFNTVVFDIKPISGQTIYQSKLAPKLTEWRGQKLPADFDPVPPMVSGCHRNGLSILVSMNAFSEGHRLFKVGPGYGEPEHQSVLYRPEPFIRARDRTWPLTSTINQISPGALEVATSIPASPLAGSIAVEVADDGHVDGAFELAGKPKVKVPAGDILLVGSGSAGDFARYNLTPGTHVEFLTKPGYVRIGDLVGGQIPLMMDPNDPEVRQHALDVIREVASKYPVDGIVYDDRLRYAGIDGDFSEASRSQFEEFVGQKLAWPDDVFRFTVDHRLHQGIVPGKWYDTWLAWRAARIKDFVADVGKTVRETRPQTKFGVYAGSWYGDYPALGHNYASDRSEPGFPFLTPTYQSAGTASLLDYLIVGCYYETATMYDAMGQGQGIGATIEGAGTLCNRLARSETWTYAGIDCGPFAHDPARLADAVQAACASTQGVMVFDLSHDMDDLWPTFAKIFGQARKAPHQVPNSLKTLRALRANYDRYGSHEPPIVIAAGSTGTGQ